MAGPSSLILSLLMIAAFVLGAGGLWTIVKQKDRQRGILMILAGLVMLANVLILTI